MRITSIKAGGERCRIKKEHEGEVNGVGFHFMDKEFQASFYSGDRAVKVSIPVAEMERLIRDYNEFKTKNPEYFEGV